MKKFILSACVCLAVALALVTFLATAPAAEAGNGNGKGNGKKCPTGPDYTYVSNDPAECAVIRYFCEPGTEPFSNECGCGCKTIGA